MAKAQHTTAVEVKITRENQAEIALAVLRRLRRRNADAIKFWKKRQAVRA